MLVEVPRRLRVGHGVRVDARDGFFESHGRRQPPVVPRELYALSAIVRCLHCSSLALAKAAGSDPGCLRMNLRTPTGGGKTRMPCWRDRLRFVT